MKEILFLCHRIPYPPNKGDKIRAFHLLSALADNYTVSLGTFVDDPEDWKHRTVLDTLCAETCYRPLSSARARVRSLAGLFNGQPLSFPYYRDRPLQQWVDRVMQQRPIGAIVVFSSAMASYAERYVQVRRVLDFVDVDSEKWRQYAPKAGIPMCWVYAREGRKLLTAERRLAATFDASVFVSEAETQLFQERAPECSARTRPVANGVDSAYFDPGLEYPDPYAEKGVRTLVFTGAMDYRANIDAVVWFVHEVLPLIRDKQADVSFCIVGARPARQVLELARHPGVAVTGTVDDVRPYLAHAAVAVAPLRIARGLQNKVLEALAMGKRVVLTPEAAAGLKPLNPEFAAVESEPQALAKCIMEFTQCTAAVRSHQGTTLAPRSTPSNGALDNSSDNRSSAPRDYILENYSWNGQLKPFLALVEGSDAVPVKTPTDPKSLAGVSA